MIVLCTGAPAFELDGEQTILSFPSGSGEAIRVALSRNQLVYLSQSSERAMIEAFDEPQRPFLSEPQKLGRNRGVA